MKYIEGLGLVVGDMRGNTLGQNALLDANGMCVRNNNSEIVRFGITDIKVVNEDGDPVYSGAGSVVKSQNNIVVSTQQTKDAGNTNAGGKAALELYYDSAKDNMSLSLSVKVEHPILICTKALEMGYMLITLIQRLCLRT